MKASSFVDPERMRRRFETLSAVGATPAGGVNRQALSREDARAQALFVAWGLERGFIALTDAAGNLFLRRPGTQLQAPLVLSGSHLDSQPTGGRYDGAYGVLAALEALEAIEDARLACSRGIELVAWMNEEGSRFAPGMMGSAALAGTRAVNDILQARDVEGISVAQALAAVRAELPALPERRLDLPLHAFVEAHIEQGPVLEHDGIALGVVTGIQGKHTFRVEVFGEAAHAGTAPHRSRQDALLAATAMVQLLASEFHDQDDITKFTIGRFTVTPNAPSVVPRHVSFSVDLRHPDSDHLRALSDRVSSICERAVGPCSVRVERLLANDSIVFDSRIQAMLHSAAAELGAATRDLPSLAGHDAGMLASVVPTGMLFIPCHLGITHDERESAEHDHMVLGAKVLADVLSALAQ